MSCIHCIKYIMFINRVGIYRHNIIGDTRSTAAYGVQTADVRLFVYFSEYTTLSKIKYLY